MDYVEMLAREEGFRRFPYRCPAGKLTIGHGFNLDDVGISEEESLALLRIRLADHVRDLESFKWWSDLSRRQRGALLNLHFAVGSGGFRKFRRMLDYLDQGLPCRAAAEVVDSRFGVTHRDRAVRIRKDLEDR